jgi:hypothetical protein
MNVVGDIRLVNAKRGGLKPAPTQMVDLSDNNIPKKEK